MDAAAVARAAAASKKEMELDADSAAPAEEAPPPQQPPPPQPPSAFRRSARLLFVRARRGARGAVCSVALRSATASPAGAHAPACRAARRALASALKPRRCNPTTPCRRRAPQPPSIYSRTLRVSDASAFSDVCAFAHVFAAQMAAFAGALAAIPAIAWHMYTHGSQLHDICAQRRASRRPFSHAR
jgi:hypothetical protein